MLSRADVLDVALRLLAATLIGGAIGLDREVRSKPAGLRTHALVCLGAALVTVVVARLSGSPLSQHVDAVSRVIQGVIAGVGFLGGGAILKAAANGSEVVSGLTTAATIWVVASLGVACGAGQWAAAVIAASFALLILILGRPIEGLAHRIFRRHPEP